MSKHILMVFKLFNMLYPVINISDSDWIFISYVLVYNDLKWLFYGKYRNCMNLSVIVSIKNKMSKGRPNLKKIRKEDFLLWNFEFLY